MQNVLCTSEKRRFKFSATKKSCGTKQLLYRLVQFPLKCKIIENSDDVVGTFVLGSTNCRRSFATTTESLDPCG